MQSSNSTVQQGPGDIQTYRAFAVFDDTVFGKVVLTGTALKSLPLLHSGEGYLGTETVIVTGNGYGTGYTLTPNFTNGTIAELPAPGTPGSGYVVAPNVYDTQSPHNKIGVGIVGNYNGVTGAIIGIQITDPQPVVYTNGFTPTIDAAPSGGANAVCAAAILSYTLGSMTVSGGSSFDTTSAFSMSAPPPYARVGTPACHIGGAVTIETDGPVGSTELLKCVYPTYGATGTGAGQAAGSPVPTRPIPSKLSG